MQYFLLWQVILRIKKRKLLSVITGKKECKHTKLKDCWVYTAVNNTNKLSWIALLFSRFSYGYTCWTVQGRRRRRIWYMLSDRVNHDKGANQDRHGWWSPALQDVGNSHQSNVEVASSTYEIWTSVLQELSLHIWLPNHFYVFKSVICFCIICNRSYLEASTFTIVLCFTSLLPLSMIKYIYNLLCNVISTTVFVIY